MKTEPVLRASDGLYRSRVIGMLHAGQHQGPLFSTSTDERQELERLVRASKTPRSHVDRARSILRMGAGVSAPDAGKELGRSRNSAYKWRPLSRITIGRIVGRCSKWATDDNYRGDDKTEPTSHRPPCAPGSHELEYPLHGHICCRHGSGSSATSGDGQSGPHRIKPLKISNDSDFSEKVIDVAGRYLNPADNTIVLSGDEKTQIQALDRAQPLLPLRPGQVERRAHDYKRHGTASPYAAFDVATGKAIGRITMRQRPKEFLDCLRQINRKIDPDVDLHLILDNSSTHKTPELRKWLQIHPQFTPPPTSASRLNAVEAWFSQFEPRAIDRGRFNSVAQARQAIRDFIDTHNTYT